MFHTLNHLLRLMRSACKSKKFQTLKFKLHAKRAVGKYARRFSGMADEALAVLVARERKCSGWTTERSYYLRALRNECKKRGLQCVW